MKSAGIASTTARAALAVIVAVLGQATLAADESVLLRRVHPTKVSWGEIVLAEGGAVRVTLRDPVRLLRYALVPHSVLIVSRERARNEDPAATYLSVPVPKPHPRGAVYLAVNMLNGEKQWRAFVEDLEARATTYTPETFADFVRNFPQIFQSHPPPIDGPFEAPMCLKLQGEADQQLEARTELLEDGTPAITVTGTGTSRPNCAQLEEALEKNMEVSTLVHRFVVHEQTDESLTLAIESRLDARPAPAPPVARLSPEALDGKAVFTRWTWRATNSRLGVGPQTLSERIERLDAAFFLPAETGFDPGVFGRGVALEFDEAEEPPGIDLLSRLLRERVAGMDGAYAIFCDGRIPDRAMLHAGPGSVPLENARDACAGVRSRLDHD